jgi:hypothetical protein
LGVEEMHVALEAGIQEDQDARESARVEAINYVIRGGR